MAKRVFETGSLSWGTQAAGTALTSSQFMAAKGGASTQNIDFFEFLVSGMATTSVVAAMTVSYSSTIGTTPTTLTSPGFDGPMFINATAISSVVVTYYAAATGPIMNAAATVPRLNLALNAFGGIIRWNAAPTQQWTSVGNAANGGETVLFNSSVGGGSGTPLLNAHIIYEPY